MSAPIQYGDGLKAYVVHLLAAQMVSLKRVAQTVHTLIGRSLSETTLLRFLSCCFARNSVTDFSVCF